jgi:hypothetical protein
MTYKPRHFILQELVCQHVFNKYGEIALTFFDEKLLLTLDLLRDQLGAIYINNWDSEGEYSQRGLRCSLCQLVQDVFKKGELFMDPHAEGQAVDFDVEGKTASEIRLWIAKNANILPYPVRLESNVDWCHLDIRDAGQKVYMFNK